MYRYLTFTNESWAPLPLRLGLGVIFIAHGAQKIFGVWGGRGFDAWLSGEVPLGLQPAKLWLAAAAFSELLGGVMVLLGLFTRLGALLICGVMAVATYGVHWKYGFFMKNNGVEYTVALLCMALSVMITGGGRASIDSTL